MQIKVNGKDYVYFNDVVINTQLDSVASTFTFLGYYDQSNPLHVELFKPLSYARVEFFDEDHADNANKGLISTGTIVHWAFKSSPEPNLVQLSGYSLPGVLDDCQIPYKAYPLETDNGTLAQIGNKLCTLFNIKQVVYDIVSKEAGQLIPKTVAKIDETIKDYLCKIANQKNVVVSHDIHGNLILYRPDVKAPVKLSLNQQNTLTMELDVDGTKIHSEITTIRQPTRGNNPKDTFIYEENKLNNINPDSPGGKVFKISSIDTVKNPLVNTYRPYVDRLTSGTFYDTHRAALNMRAAELKNIRVSFALDYWAPISIGDIIEVINPEIFINNKVKMVLESTVIQESSTRKTMTGSLVLLETFTGDEPQNIF
jgi:prophage tail gpP-like protein